MMYCPYCQRVIMPEPLIKGVSGDVGGWVYMHNEEVIHPQDFAIDELENAAMFAGLQ